MASIHLKLKHSGCYLGRDPNLCNEKEIGDLNDIGLTGKKYTETNSPLQWLHIKILKYFQYMFLTTRYCSLWWLWPPEGQWQVWVVLLKLGAAGGRSHTPLEEHSSRSAAAGPGKHTIHMKEELVQWQCFCLYRCTLKQKKRSFPLYLWYNSQSIYYMLLTVQAKTKTRVKYAFMLQLVIILTYRAAIRDVSLRLYYQRTKWKENNQLLLALWSFMVSCLLFSSPAHNFNAVFIG